MKYKLGEIERDIWRAFKNKKKVHREVVYDFGDSQGYYDKQIDNALQRLAMKGLIRYSHAGLCWVR